MKKKYILKKNFEFFLAYKLPGHPWVFKKISAHSVQPFDLLWTTYIHIYECLFLLYRFIYIFGFRSLEVDWLKITPLNLVGQDFPATGEEFFPQGGVMPLYNQLAVKCLALPVEFWRKILNIKQIYRFWKNNIFDFL